VSLGMGVARCAGVPQPPGTLAEVSETSDETSEAGLTVRQLEADKHLGDGAVVDAVGVLVAGSGWVADAAYAAEPVVAAAAQSAALVAGVMGRGAANESQYHHVCLDASSSNVSLVDHCE